MLALVKELRTLAKVTVVAPDHNWSASGHVKTMHRPLRVRETLLDDGSPAFSSDGAPSDCVAIAMLGLLPEKIDMVVSGINPNANLGHDVTYSGTVTAAMEAAIWNTPGIAVSLDSPENHVGVLDYSTAAKAGRMVCEKVFKESLDKNTLLNVNVPYLPFEKLKGFCVTRQGLRIYRDELVRRIDPRGKPYYWIGGDVPTGIPEKETDFGALKEGWVSITPLELDLTAYQSIERLKQWSFRVD